MVRCIITISVAWKKKKKKKKKKKRKGEDITRGQSERNFKEKKRIMFEEEG